MRTSRTSRAAGVVTPASANSLFGRRRGSRSAPRNRSQVDGQISGIGGVIDGGSVPEEIVDTRSGTTEIPAHTRLPARDRAVVQVVVLVPSRPATGRRDDRVRSARVR